MPNPRRGWRLCQQVKGKSKSGPNRDVLEENTRQAQPERPQTMGLSSLRPEYTSDQACFGALVLKGWSLSIFQFGTDGTLFSGHPRESSDLGLDESSRS